MEAIGQRSAAAVLGAIHCVRVCVSISGTVTILIRFESGFFFPGTLSATAASTAIATMPMPLSDEKMINCLRLCHGLAIFLYLFIYYHYYHYGSKTDRPAQEISGSNHRTTLTTNHQRL